MSDEPNPKMQASTCTEHAGARGGVLNMEELRPVHRLLSFLCLCHTKIWHVCMWLVA